MEEKKIVIDISEDGSIHAETFGMIGVECVSELDKLMKDLARSGTHKHKPEYYKEGIQADTTVRVKNG